MYAIAKGLWVVAFAGAMAMPAMADGPTPANIAVKGSAPEVCSLGGWTYVSGPGSFSGGTNATVTYSNDQMVDGLANSILGPGSAMTLHAPLLCNTAINWSITTSKGALRLESGTTPPSGFASQWLYELRSGPYTSGGTAVASIEVDDADGTPLSGESHGLTSVKATQIAYFGLTFSPFAQSARMLAGSYSESVTLTVSPSL